MVFIKRMFRVNLLKNLLSYQYTSRLSSHQANLSVRQRAWNEAQQKYAQFAPHIIYSSFIENYDYYNNFQNNKTTKETDFSSLVDFPTNWMDDYEFYKGSVDEGGNLNSRHGTADASIPPSKIPCNGCGAHLHCASVSLPGYIPKEIFMGRNDKELRTIICQRCHFLKNYNISLDVEVSAETYVQTLSAIKDEFALALVIVDLLDFPCSIWPDMPSLVGSKRPVFIVGNKVDLLPRDSNSYLDRVKECLKQQIIASGGLNAMNIKHISLISAKTGYGIEELITQLHNIWKYKGNVYLMGCTNVGKSSLFNILLNSDYCRPEATDLVRKATACPWPGTTLRMLKFPILRPSDIRVHQRFKRLLSERYQKAAEEKLRRDQARKTGSVQAAQLVGNIGRTFHRHNEVNDAFAMSEGVQPIITLNERGKEYREAKWCFDTPGVLHPDQLTDLLTTAELLKLQPKEMIRPRAIRLGVGKSIFLGGLARLDFLDCTNEQSQLDYIQVFVFSSPQLPIVVSPTEHAADMYTKYLGSELLGMPFGTPERLQRWPGLKSNDADMHISGQSSSLSKELTCDIVLSSAGWIGLHIPEGQHCTFKAWTPRGMGIYLRTPPLIPYANRLIGKRIRNSLAYHISKPFVFRK